MFDIEDSDSYSCSKFCHVSAKLNKLVLAPK